MSKVHMLRCFVNQRLTAAAQEICGLFERTLAEYEEELCSSQEENERHRKRLQAVFNPEVRLQRADVEQLLVVKEEQQEWRFSLDQEDPEPPHIKDDQEDLWTNQEGEQLEDVQQLLEVQEEIPLEQQDWSSSLDQVEPDPLHIKEEQEELWTSQEGEQLEGLEEAGIRDAAKQQM
ncbi:hypothetical protein EYF80_047894 [Liparis tanakae]|uniref:Uncharacterized protein n=1 Tax=Liparis tanakae TaxID=230148 RepID=A0A4Z2FL03_9TELE|nr:hypothetical protein EYF80_047894 [Liparis tanakae]